MCLSSLSADPKSPVRITPLMFLTQKKGAPPLQPNDFRKGEFLEEEQMPVQNSTTTFRRAVVAVAKNNSVQCTDYIIYSVVDAVWVLHVCLFQAKKIRNMHTNTRRSQCHGAVLTGQGCSALPQPPWHIAVTSVATEADWRSLLAWTWWQIGPTRWNPGTPVGDTPQTWEERTFDWFNYIYSCFYVDETAQTWKHHQFIALLGLNLVVMAFTVILKANKNGWCIIFNHMVDAAILSWRMSENLHVTGCTGLSKQFQLVNMCGWIFIF